MSHDPARNRWAASATVSPRLYGSCELVVNSLKVRAPLSKTLRCALLLGALVATLGRLDMPAPAGASPGGLDANGCHTCRTNCAAYGLSTDGGIFAFNAPFRGSMGGQPLNRPVIGALAHGNGYLMVASDGGIFAFTNQPFLGSLGGNPPPRSIVGVAVRRR